MRRVIDDPRLFPPGIYPRYCRNDGKLIPYSTHYGQAVYSERLFCCRACRAEKSARHEPTVKSCARCGSEFKKGREAWTRFLARELCASCSAVMGGEKRRRGAPPAPPVSDLRDLQVLERDRQRLFVDSPLYRQRVMRGALTW